MINYTYFYHLCIKRTIISIRIHSERGRLSHSRASVCVRMRVCECFKIIRKACYENINCLRVYYLHVECVFRATPN